MRRRFILCRCGAGMGNAPSLPRDVSHWPAGRCIFESPPRLVPLKMIKIDYRQPQASCCLSSTYFYIYWRNRFMALTVQKLRIARQGASCATLSIPMASAPPKKVARWTLRPALSLSRMNRLRHYTWPNSSAALGIRSSLRPVAALRPFNMPSPSTPMSCSWTSICTGLWTALTPHDTFRPRRRSPWST
jgi:hypothetical protein